MWHVNDAGPEVLRQDFKYLSPLWDHTLKSNLLVSGNSKYQRTLLPGNLIVSQLDLSQLVLYEEGWFACLLLYRCCLTSIYFICKFHIILFYVWYPSMCSKKLKAEALCEAILLARLREEQWNEMPMKERRKEIYVLVRNLRSTAYRLALATIILEQQEEDMEFMWHAVCSSWEKEHTGHIHLNAGEKYI